MASFGYILEPKENHYDSDVQLPKFSSNPKKFKISVVFALIEHFCVIALPILLFIAFSHYNLIFGYIWAISRVAEGPIQVYIEKDYWKLLNIAKKYSNSSGTEKDSLNNSHRRILQNKGDRFAVAMICWSVGTLTFSILLIIYQVVPFFIGLLGIIASIPIGLSNVIKFVKPDSRFYEITSSIGGLLAIVFEGIIGVWLLFFYTLPIFPIF